MVEYKCKICGEGVNLSDSFCPQCGFEHHILPEPISVEVKMYEENRIKVCKKVWEEHNQGLKLRKAYDDEMAKKKTLEQELEKARKKTQSVEEEKERYKAQVDKAQKELSSAKKDNQGLVDKVLNLTSRNNTLENKMNIALIELEKAKKSNQLSGIVLITDTENDFHAVAPINSGINTFGSEASKDNHHMVRLGPFSTQLTPKHFSVESIGKHLLLKDMTGGAMNLPTSGMYVEGKTIKLCNNIEIKFLKIL